METCLRVQAKDTTKNPHQNPNKENANKYCYPAQLLTGDYAGLKQYHLARRWERTCPDMQDTLVQFANNSRGVTGSLELREAEVAGGNTEAEYRCIYYICRIVLLCFHYRIPGTGFKFKCSTGFHLPTNQDNPYQVTSILCTTV